MTCFFTYLKRGLFHMKYEYHKTISEILDDYLQENYPNDCRKETIEKATYEIYDYTEGAYFSSDCSKVPMTMINGSIEFSPSYDELLNLDFILFICGNEIMYMYDDYYNDKVYKVETIPFKALKEYFLERYPSADYDAAINNLSYSVTEYRKGFFVPYDNMSMGQMISTDSNVNIPVNMICGVITYLLNSGDTKQMNFTVYEYKEKIMYLKKIQY